MMKKLFVLLVSFGISSAVFAQKYAPVIKQGTVLSYTALSKAMGMEVPLTLTLASVTAPVKMQWSIDGLGTGSFEVSAKAVESATKMAIRQPEPNGVTKLKDDETLLLLSKSMYDGLTKDKSFTLNGKTFTVMPDTSAYKINDKEADVIYAETANGKGKIWILNNADMPIVCKATGSIPGFDISLTAITE